MYSLYLLPHGTVIALVLLMAPVVFCQAFRTVRCLYGLRYGSGLGGCLPECTLLLDLFAAMTALAHCAYQMTCGFVSARSFDGWRTGAWLLLAAVCLWFAFVTKRPRALFAPLAAALMLPAAERFSGRWFPLLLALSLLLLLVRTLWLLLPSESEPRQQSSAFSVKEAVDRLDSGLLFCRSGGRADGQILLANTKMQQLMAALCGRTVRNGRRFCTLLENGGVRPGCERKSGGEGPVYRLPGGRVWAFSLRQLRVRKEDCFLLVASDVTDFSEANAKLYEQGRELQRRNGELKIMLQNLEDTCRTEELLRMKSRIHDLLAQRISLLLRSVREHREPDEKLLASFAEGLPQMLREVPVDRACTIRMLTEDFRDLGVQVITEGQLPEAEPIQKAFFEIAMEAVSNAVRHGFATEIRVTVRQEGGLHRLTVTDNGLSAEGPIAEGGGFAGMRRRAEALGGSFRFAKEPVFTVTVEIPEGGTV